MNDTREAQEAGELLERVEHLRSATRVRVRGAWFPLLVFGAITLASTALYNRPFAYPRGGPFRAGPFMTPYHAGLPGARSQLVAYLFWVVAAPAGYLASAWWYRWRARRLGVSFPWERWVWTGIGLFALLQVMLALPVHEAGRNLGGGLFEIGSASAAVDVQIRAAAFLTPLVAVAAGLLVLSWVERSWIVAASALLFGGFTVLVNTYGLGQVPPWIVRPYGATRDIFVAPATNLVVLATILFAAAALSAARNRRYRATP